MDISPLICAMTLKDRTMATQRQKAEIFKALHLSPTGFLMPNVSDPGSAIVLAQEGFPPRAPECRRLVLTRQV